MRSDPQRCPHCGGEVMVRAVDIHFVQPDGCRLWAHDRNVRTRDTTGHGEGSLADEFARGVGTPWTSAEHKRRAVAHLDGELLAFATSLPYVRVEDEG